MVMPGTDVDAGGSVALFRLSQQVSKVRDTAKWLIRRGYGDPASARRLAEMLTSLNASVASHVTDDLAGELSSVIHCPRPDDGLVEVYVSAAQLAAWLHSVQTTRSFEVSVKVLRVSAQKMTEALADAAVSAPEPAS
jgi:hypothetical protein